MNPNETPARLDALPAGSATGIVILYEDVSSGRSAKRFADLLAMKLAGGCAGAATLWRCELLESPELAGEIARDTVGSEFVIVSLRGDACLARAARDLLEAWLAQSAGRPASLIALFDPAHSTMRVVESVRIDLRQMATASGVAFFSHCAVEPATAGGRHFASDEEPLALPKRHRRARNARELVLGGAQAA